ncbi:hypothetical protein [Halosimplex pelagicum]|uniref:DUF4145 domain-containing protein n=1 Tax=Halosimplex pelagicum TaxID=869886 RepID=A0A7D5P6D5_9EURY|nr:hypothetical protein [Halosimplex pelagicum]QLH81983.1 hypothetical protein HZS54_10285 [Halosimplex pelagicum]
MDRIDFLGFVLLLRDISRLDRYSTRQFTPESESDRGQDVRQLFNQYGVTAQLSTLAGTDSEIYQNYQKAVNEFKERDYRDTVRDLGVASEELIDHFCRQVYKEGEVSDNMTARLNQLDKTEDGLASYIGKTVSAAWWLRNKASHNADYESTEADAHYALLCYQIAVETYVEDFLEAEVSY